MPTERVLVLPCSFYFISHVQSAPVHGCPRCDAPCAQRRLRLVAERLVEFLPGVRVPGVSSSARAVTAGLCW